MRRAFITFAAVLISVVCTWAQMTPQFSVSSRAGEMMCDIYFGYFGHEVVIDNKTLYECITTLEHLSDSIRTDALIFNPYATPGISIKEISFLRNGQVYYMIDTFPLSDSIKWENANTGKKLINGLQDTALLCSSHSRLLLEQPNTFFRTDTFKLLLLKKPEDTYQSIQKLIIKRKTGSLQFDKNLLISKGKNKYKQTYNEMFDLTGKMQHTLPNSFILILKKGPIGESVGKK